MTPRSFDLLLISRVRKKLETQRRSNNRSKAERSQLGAGRHIDQRRHYGRPSNVFHRAGSGASKYYDDAYTLKNECDTITIETVETANPMAATVIGSVAHRPWGLGGGVGNGCRSTRKSKGVAPHSHTQTKKTLPTRCEREEPVKSGRRLTKKEVGPDKKMVPHLHIRQCVCVLKRQPWQVWASPGISILRHALLMMFGDVQRADQGRRLFKKKIQNRQKKRKENRKKTATTQMNEKETRKKIRYEETPAERRWQNKKAKKPNKKSSIN